MNECPGCRHRFQPRRKSSKYCSHACYADSRKGSAVAGGFAPGSRPANKSPVGTVRVRTRHSRGGVKRAWVKVAEPNVWELRAWLVWEAERGPIPAGHHIHHTDRDTLNDSIENLECVSASAHAVEHHAETVAARKANGYRAADKVLACVRCCDSIVGRHNTKYCRPCRKEAARESHRRYRAKARAR